MISNLTFFYCNSFRLLAVKNSYQNETNDVHKAMRTIQIGISSFTAFLIIKYTFLIWSGLDFTLGIQVCKYGDEVVSAANPVAIRALSLIDMPLLIVGSLILDLLTVRILHKKIYPWLE